MISTLRYHDLTKADTVITKISQVISFPRLFTALLLVFASLCDISTTHSFTHYLYASLNQV